MHYSIYLYILQAVAVSHVKSNHWGGKISRKKQFKRKRYKHLPFQTDRSANYAYGGFK